MKAKTSAHYQREYRTRLREQGLVKKEVWVLPEHAKALSAVEAKLRLPAGITQDMGDDTMTEAPLAWSASELFAALKKERPFSEGGASLELIDGIAPSLHIEMYEYGDLPIFLSVVGEQIIVEAVLWSIDDVRDLADFNSAVLKTHKYFPLSTISLESVKGMPDHYHMFGALSASSLLSNVVLEIDMLALNVIQATEAYSEFLNFPVEVSI